MIKEFISCSKVNVIAQLEFELAHYDITVQHISYYTTLLLWYGGTSGVKVIIIENGHNISSNHGPGCLHFTCTNALKKSHETISSTPSYR